MPKLSASPFSDLSESDDPESAILETIPVDGKKQHQSHRSNNIIKKTRTLNKNFDTNTTELTHQKISSKLRKKQVKRMLPGNFCCSKKCSCLTFVTVYISLDALFNLFFVTFSDKITKNLHETLITPNITKSFNKFPTFQNFNIKTSTYDVWVTSLARDAFLFLVMITVAIKHRLVYRFIRFVHKKYISAFICLAMYSYAMLKMLFHSDQAFINERPPDNTSMIMFIWNIISAFLFFIAWYMLSLLKLRVDYQKTDVDGGDIGDNEEGEEDIFLETLKETKKKRSSLLRLFKYSGQDWHFILCGTVFLIAGAICEAFVPYYTGQVLDSIVVKQDFDNFKENAKHFILAHFLSGMLGGVRTCMFTIGVSRLNVRLRKMVYKSLIEQDIGFFDKVKTGDMLSRLSADTTTMSDLISQNLNGFLWNLVKTVGTLAFILTLSWQLSLTCFIGAPIVFSIGKFYGNYYKKLSVQVQKHMADANHVAEESLSTIRTVRSFANEAGEMYSYSNELKKMLRVKIKQAGLFTTYDWAVKIAELCMTVSMLTFGAYLVSTKQITSGNFMSFVIYQLTLTTCLEGLTSVYTGLMNAAGASEKVFEYLDITPSMQITRSYEPDTTIQGGIEFKNVDFAYPTRIDVPILKNISFTCKPGEVVALVGPSGSGKSSCVSLLERFYKPLKGEILIDGVKIDDYNHKFIHRVIALVGQEPVLYGRNIKRNIAYGLDDECIEDEQIISAAKMANAHNFIMETTAKYETECGERGTQLSGGQKQRIAIARALIRNPRILLLDEATSALDAESEYLVQQAIHKNLKGHTVVVVAHRLSTIENADKIIVIDHGEIVEQGNHKELLKKNGLYAYLVQKQMSGDKEDDRDKDSVVSISGQSTPLVNIAAKRISERN